MMKRWAMVMAIMGLTATAGLAEEKAASSTGSPESKSALSVEKMVLCTGVQDREPVGEASSFSAEVGKVYCWLTVVGAESETQIKQGWWYKGELLFELPLTIRTARFRTWGTKTIQSNQTGEWTVKVTDSEGHVLKEATFTVTASGQDATPASSDTKK